MTSLNKTAQERLNSALLDAANRGDVDGVKTALEQGADVDAEDEYGESPIEKALLRAYSPDGIKALIDAGAKLPANWDWVFALMRLNTTMSKTDKEELRAYIKAKAL